MNLARRVATAAVGLDRLPRPAPHGDPLPGHVIAVITEGMRLVDARDAHAGDSAWDAIDPRAFHAAGLLAIELDLIDGCEVPDWRVDAVERRLPTPAEPDLDQVPEPELDESASMSAAELVERDGQRHPDPPPLDNRTGMRRALGRPPDSLIEALHMLRL